MMTWTLPGARLRTGPRDSWKSLTKKLTSTQMGTEDRTAATTHISCSLSNSSTGTSTTSATAQALEIRPNLSSTDCARWHLITPWAQLLSPTPLFSLASPSWSGTVCHRLRIGLRTLISLARDVFLLTLSTFRSSLAPSLAVYCL
jgi:hypothetical protein